MRSDFESFVNTECIFLADTNSVSVHLALSSLLKILYVKSIFGRVEVMSRLGKLVIFLENSPFLNPLVSNFGWS